MDTHQEVGQFTKKSKLGIVFLVANTNILFCLIQMLGSYFKGIRFILI